MVWEKTGEKELLKPFSPAEMLDQFSSLAAEYPGSKTDQQTECADEGHGIGQVVRRSSASRLTKRY